MLSEWFGNIEFAYSWVLALLFLIPILIWEYVKRNARNSASMMVTTTHFLNRTRNYRVILRHSLFALRCLAIILLVIALARPRLKYAETEYNGEGIDIVLCLDISGSMNERDFLPNRIEASKDVAREFVSQRPGDRIGLVIFSIVSYTLCPITVDHNAVLSQLNVIQSGYLKEDGTAIGSGLATSVDRLRDSKAKSKVIILLTDGVDIGGEIPPDIAMKMAAMYNIKVYTIGVGSEREIEEPVEGGFPGKVKRKLEFNEDLLMQIAHETGGQYFHATNKEALQKIYTSINQLEKSKISSVTYDRYKDKYLLLVFTALGLLVLEMVLKYTVFRKFP